MMKKIKLQNALSYVVLTIGALIMVFPFYWMFISGLKSASEVASFPPVWWPSKLMFENYKTAWNYAPFGTYLVNSLITVLSSITITTFTTIIAAFAFSRLKWKGRDTVLTLLLAMMMVPFEMLVITNYMTIAKLGLIDTKWALIIPFTSSIFYTYILRNFFVSISDSLYNSARIDGCSNWKYLWRVMVPIARPSLVTIILLNGLASWNSFMWPLLVVNSKVNRTLPLGLYAFVTEAGTHFELMMAASTLIVLPAIILFLFARKYIVQGVARGGLKG